MYNDPKLSAQAKRLRTELLAFEAPLTHAQCLEVLARLNGERTLHVAQAKNNAPVDIPTLALKQAAALVFNTLGRFDGQVTGLIESIRAAFELESVSSRDVEAAVAEIFEADNAPKVSALFDAHLLEDLPALFDATVEKLTRVLTQQAKAPAPGEKSDEACVLDTTVYDWRVSDGETLSDLPEDHQQAYSLKVVRMGHQLTVDVVPKHATDDQLREGTLNQMGLFIEINDGRPCVHMSNFVLGDQVLSVFFTPDGLYLRPESDDLSISHGRPDAASLQLLDKELRAPYENLYPRALQDTPRYVPLRNAASIDTTRYCR